MPRVNSSSLLATFGPYLWAGAITAIISTPWLATGFLFGTDWPGPRFIRWPAEVSSWSPFEALLSAGSAIGSAELTTKLLVLASLFVAALAAYSALPYGDFVPRAAASLIYVLNPFIYGRLHYGQFFLIGGYAVLPWVAMRTQRLVASPSIRQSVWLAGSILTVVLLAVHLSVPIMVLVGVAAVSAGAYGLLQLAYIARLGLSLLVTLAATLIVSSYWLIPYLAGRSAESRIIAQVGSRDLAAFQTVGDPVAGLIPNLLGLYGFWAEGVHRFPSMKLFVPYWNVALMALLAFAALGAISVFLSRKEVVRKLRWWVLALAITGLIGLLLDAGVAEPHVAPFVRWLDAVFPPYRGMRDAGKWASILAVVYAQLIPLGLIATRDWLKSLTKGRPLDEVGGAVVAALALALPLYYGNGLLFGMHGQIQPSSYPAGWYAADRVMAADPQHERALFLPWHHYFRLSFVRNVDSVIANPAPDFFSIPIVVSANPEVIGILPPDTPDQRTIQALVNDGRAGDWGHVLASRNVKYVVVAKEVDWQSFQYLDQQAGLTRIADYGSIRLYRVMAKN